MKLHQMKEIQNKFYDYDKDKCILQYRSDSDSDSVPMEVNLSKNLDDDICSSLDDFLSDISEKNCKSITNQDLKSEDLQYIYDLDNINLLLEYSDPEICDLLKVIRNKNIYRNINWNKTINNFSQANDIMEKHQTSNKFVDITNNGINNNQMDSPTPRKLVAKKRKRKTSFYTKLNKKYGASKENNKSMKPILDDFNLINKIEEKSTDSSPQNSKSPNKDHAATPCATKRFFLRARYTTPQLNNKKSVDSEKIQTIDEYTNTPDIYEEESTLIKTSKLKLININGTPCGGVSKKVELAKKTDKVNKELIKAIAPDKGRTFFDKSHEKMLVNNNSNINNNNDINEKVIRDEEYTKSTLNSNTTSSPNIKKNENLPINEIAVNNITPNLKSPNKEYTAITSARKRRKKQARYSMSQFNNKRPATIKKHQTTVEYTNTPDKYEDDSTLIKTSNLKLINIIHEGVGRKDELLEKPDVMDKEMVFVETIPPDRGITFLNKSHNLLLLNNNSNINNINDINGKVIGNDECTKPILISKTTESPTIKKNKELPIVLLHDINVKEVAVNHITPNLKRPITECAIVASPIKRRKKQARYTINGFNKKKSTPNRKSEAINKCTNKSDEHGEDHRLNKNNKLKKISDNITAPKDTRKTDEVVQKTDIVNNERIFVEPDKYNGFLDKSYKTLVLNNKSHINKNTDIIKNDEHAKLIINSQRKDSPNIIANKEFPILKLVDICDIVAVSNTSNLKELGDKKTVTSGKELGNTIVRSMKKRKGRPRRYTFTYKFSKKSSTKKNIILDKLNVTNPTAVPNPRNRRKLFCLEKYMNGLFMEPEPSKFH